MKKNWLLYLVIFSLALNFGTIGALVYFRYQDRQLAVARDAERHLGLGQLLRAVEVTPDQKKVLLRLMPPHRQQVTDIQRRLAGERRQLFLLLQQEDPSMAALENQIQRISAVQAELEKEMVGFLLQVRQNLAPAQRRQLIDTLNRRFCTRMTHLGHPVSPEELGNEPPGRGNRWGRARPGGPPPPPPPPHGE